MTIRVILIDDHELFREGIIKLLNDEPGIDLVATFSGGREAIEYIEASPPDVAAIDVALPKLNGIEVARKIHDVMPTIQILMLSAYVDPEYVYQSLRAGAQGYVAKDVAGRVLVQAVQTVYAGKQFLSDQANTEALRQFLKSRGADNQVGSLSMREREVLQLTVEGRTIAESGEILSISPKSVETYRRRMMIKLELNDVPALVKFAIRHGLTSPE